MNMIYIILFHIILIHKISSEQTLQCGDWITFKDAKCIKVFDNKDLQNHSDAKNKCYQNEESSLISIRSEEEQRILFNILHSQYNIINDVWIGAHYDRNILIWTDNATNNYTNWANGNPRNDSGYECVQMEMVEPYHGQWFNTPCTKNNVVVCQKPQNWLFYYLQKTVMELRETVQNISKKLENTENELLNTKQLLQQEINKRSIESAPPGTITYFANTTAPIGWLKANGQTVSRITYDKLFATIGTSYGSGDGSTTFTLPDLRGEFIRSWSDGRDVDKARIFGSFQYGSSIPSESAINGYVDLSAVIGYHDRWSFAGNTFYDGFEGDIPSGQTRVAVTFPVNNYQSEMGYIKGTNVGNVTHWNLMKGTRPRNIALLACIKY